MVTTTTTYSFSSSSSSLEEGVYVNFFSGEICY